VADVSEYIRELEVVANTLGTLIAEYESPEVKGQLDALDEAVDAVDRTWSKSNLGYHARVYYHDFETPAATAIVDPSWGLSTDKEWQHNGYWRVYDEDTVRAQVLARAGDVELRPLHAKGDATRSAILRQKAAITSILTACLMIRHDPYLRQIKTEVEDVSAPNASTFARSYVGTGQQIVTVDVLAKNQGMQLAPHQLIRGELRAIEAPYVCAQALAEHARSAANHLRRMPTDMPVAVMAQMGSRVFIGHGGSPQWRELKEYIQDKLGVPVDEFNRVPVAGLTTGARLSEMLNNAAMAFLVMTAEDETPEGKYVARQNVVHEVGLFQGKLGFEKAIVMLEEGCEQFSNIHGLNQVRYPTGNISAKFHEVHELLKREKLL
jgi:predicted nucleotide-binding protein